MSDEQEHQKQTLNMLRNVRASWKKALLGLPVLIIGTFLYFYGMNMITYPWAYHLTPTTPQGNWIGTLPLNANQSFLVNIEMAHDTVFSDTQSNRIPEISGQISICARSGVVTASSVWGDPKWTGSSVVLGTKLDFGTKIVPEKIACKAVKNGLECIFDFEQPISRASKKFREEFKNVYTPKAEFKAKIPVTFVPLKKNEKPFADQCAQQRAG
jgi:hypothetical protein